ncbi:MAG: helix-turn-helix domain-containing protein, partial [Burkholderiales bacterium]
LLATQTEITPEVLMLPLDDGQMQPFSAAKGQSLVGRSMESVERELILTTMDHCLGDSTHAANILGISIKALRDKLRHYQANQT